MSTYYRRRVLKPAKRNEPATVTPVEEVATKNNINRLLAGYMAHEILTRGTIFDQEWDPARAEATPVSMKDTKKAKKRARGSPPSVKLKCYEEVTILLKGDGGAQIPGIVNPTELACWLQK